MAAHAQGRQPGLGRVVVVPRADSTNALLAAARVEDPESWPHLSALRAEHQVAGRGRAGRQWVTPAGEALTVSVLVEPDPAAGAVASSDWASLTAVAALAVVTALRDLDPRLDAAVKWPNDVVLRGLDVSAEPGWERTRKVAGILAEVVAGARAGASDAVVLGIGVNVRQLELPVPWATSLAQAGVDTTPARLLDLLGPALATLVERWRVGGFPDLAEEVASVSDTLGREVRVELPDGAAHGIAERLDGVGRLVLQTSGGERVVVAAGDVVHLRAVHLRGVPLRAPEAPR